MATEDSKCTANLGSQDTLMLNMFNIAVVWWLLPVLVKIWEKQSKSIPDGIMFSALQASQPGAAANFAIRAGRNHEERLFMFYNGIRTPENPETPAKVPWYMVLIHIIIDAGSVLYPVISLFAKRPDCDTVDSLPLLWFYPSLPGAVFGLWIARWLLDCCIRSRPWFFDSHMAQLHGHWGYHHVLLADLGILLHGYPSSDIHSL
jgi:hypothetical protein